MYRMVRDVLGELQEHALCVICYKRSYKLYVNLALLSPYSCCIVTMNPKINHKLSFNCIAFVVDNEINVVYRNIV